MHVKSNVRIWIFTERHRLDFFGLIFLSSVVNRNSIWGFWNDVIVRWDGFGAGVLCPPHQPKAKRTWLQNFSCIWIINPSGLDIYMAIGESLLMSLFTFFLIRIRRICGRIYELNSRVERADELEQFVQFSALCK